MLAQPDDLAYIDGMTPREPSRFVTRAGEKLAAGLDQFQVDVHDLVCADLGCHEGGFVDCLLQAGAAKVYAVDTGYGVLAWKLRKDPRVVVRERTNAMHVELPEPVNLVTIDVGWTRQDKILPHANTLLESDGRIITLIKPQYESDETQRAKGVVSGEAMASILEATLDRIRGCGFDVRGCVESPLRGHGGNKEFLALLASATTES